MGALVRQQELEHFLAYKGCEFLFRDGSKGDNSGMTVASAEHVLGPTSQAFPVSLQSLTLSVSARRWSLYGSHAMLALAAMCGLILMTARWPTS